MGHTWASEDRPEVNCIAMLVYIDHSTLEHVCFLAWECTCSESVQVLMFMPEHASGMEIRGQRRELDLSLLCGFQSLNTQDIRVALSSLTHKPTGWHSFCF